MAKPPDGNPLVPDKSVRNVHETVLALARLLGRQAAREAIRTARDDVQVSDPAPTTPPTTIEEEYPPLAVLRYAEVVNGAPEARP